MSLGKRSYEVSEVLWRGKDVIGLTVSLHCAREQQDGGNEMHLDQSVSQSQITRMRGSGSN
jgi:hypothetical protein